MLPLWDVIVASKPDRASHNTKIVDAKVCHVWMFVVQLTRGVSRLYGQNDIKKESGRCQSNYKGKLTHLSNSN